MNVTTFTAKVAHASKETDYFMVGFADDMYDYKNYIILQKAFEFDEQDVEQGMDGEYLEVNGQENSGYKCCKQAILSKDSFVLDIDSAPDQINRIEVLLNEVKISKKLISYLQEILGDKLELA